MLYYIVSACAMLYGVVLQCLFYFMLYYIKLHYTILCCILICLEYATLSYGMLYCSVHYEIIPD